MFDLASLRLEVAEHVVRVLSVRIVIGLDLHRVQAFDTPLDAHGAHQFAYLRRRRLRPLRQLLSVRYHFLTLPPPLADKVSIHFETGRVQVHERQLLQLTFHVPDAKLVLQQRIASTSGASSSEMLGRSG